MDLNRSSTDVAGEKWSCVVETIDLYSIITYSAS